MNEIFVIVICVVIILLLIKYIFRLWSQISELKSKKKSKEVLFGKQIEHFAPFIEGFGFNPKDARFIGSPIDYVIFDEQEIVFMDIKTGKSKLTKRERKIKELIDLKRVNWVTFNV